MELIGWICIGILFFYMIRNIWAGSFLYPIATEMRKPTEKYLKQKVPIRNYYLFVLNPFWWTVPQVFKNKQDRLIAKEAIRLTIKLYSNLRNSQ